MTISPEAIALARQRVFSREASGGLIVVILCDGAGPWQTITIKPGPDQAQLVVEHIESNVQALASFVQLGLDAGAADREAQATVRELGYKLDSAGHEWFETEKERDAARADLATLRRLALDAVNAVGLCPCHDPDGDCAKIRTLSDALPPEAP